MSRRVNPLSARVLLLTAVATLMILHDSYDDKRHEFPGGSVPFVARPVAAGIVQGYFTFMSP